jgi:deoxyadenosine/deoxycytidine kinase
MKICIEGSIGVGKSTLLELLKDYGFVIETEAVEHWTLLPHLYSNPSANTNALFEIQVICSLASRNQLAQITERSLQSTLHVFVPLLIKDEHHLKIIDSVQNLVSETEPDLIIFLDCDIDEAMERIKKRDRNSENAITKLYLQELQLKYNEWLRLQPQKYVRINVSNLNPKQVFDIVLQTIITS